MRLWTILRLTSCVIWACLLASCSQILPTEPAPPKGPDFCLVSNSGEYSVTQETFDYLAANSARFLGNALKDRQTWREFDCERIRQTMEAG